jgi:hypothetical protein
MAKTVYFTSHSIINFCFPWGVLVNYYEIPPLYASFLQKKERGDVIHDEMLECFAPHERNVIRFLTGDDAQRQDKLKLIPVCIEGYVQWGFLCKNVDMDVTS